MKVVIIGAGTAAINVADILVQDRNFQLAGFVGTEEEEKTLAGKKLFEDVAFLGGRSILPKLKENDIYGFIVGIGESILREKAFYEAKIAGLAPINAVSRNAVIQPSAQIGKGVVISAGCVIGHNVSIGDNSYLGSGAILEINTRVGVNCHLFPGCLVSGNCEVGKNVILGVRSSVLPNIKIGKNQRVDHGVVVMNHLVDLARDQG